MPNNTFGPYLIVSYSQIWCISGSVRCYRLVGNDGITVFENDTINHISKLLMPPETLPTYLSRQDQLMSHCQRGFTAATVFAFVGSESDRSKDRLNRVGGTDVFPMLSRTIIAG